MVAVGRKTDAHPSRDLDACLCAHSGVVGFRAASISQFASIICTVNGLLKLSFSGFPSTVLAVHLYVIVFPLISDIYFSIKVPRSEVS